MLPAATASGGIVKPGATTQPAGLPTADAGDFPTGIAVDDAMRTAYVGIGGNQFEMIDTTTCNATHEKGCAAVTAVPSGGEDSLGVAVDTRTQTLYVVNAATDTLAVVNAATCNALDTSGCVSHPTLVPLSGDPEFLVVDDATDTVYVAGTGDRGNDVAVLDGARCNAAVTSGCSTPPAEVALDGSPFPIALDDATDTIYVGLFGAPSAGGPLADSVAVIDGARCNAAEPSCRGAVSYARAGAAPAGIAVDTSTNYVYVTSETGSLAILNGRLCNGLRHRLCATPMFVARLDPGAMLRGDIVDATHDTLYVTDGSGNTVEGISTTSCRYADKSGCKSGNFVVTGTSPRRLALDDAVSTLYVVNTRSATVTAVDDATCNGSEKTGC